MMIENNKQLNELILEQVIDYLTNLKITDSSQKGIKMGRIPKAEKVKAIEVLRTNDQHGLSDEDFYLLEEEDPETSYSKRFEKRRELDKNLKILAENVLKSCAGGGDDSISSPNGDTNVSSPLASVNNIVSKTTKTRRNHSASSSNHGLGKSSKDVKSSVLVNSIKQQHSSSSDDAELMAIIENLDANGARSPESSTRSSSTTSSNHRRTVCLDSREDYMSRFLTLLLDKTEKLDKLNAQEYDEIDNLNSTSINSNGVATAVAGSGSGGGGSGGGSGNQISSRSTNLLIKNLLNLHKPLKYSNIIPKTVYCNLFMNSFLLYDSNYLLISSLLNDKIYQVYNEHTKNINFYYDRAKELSENAELSAEASQQQADLTLEKVWSSLVESIPEFVKTVIAFAKEIPGLNELNQKDFAVIINHKLFDFFIISNSILFINGESYLYLPHNIRYTRYWMSRIKTREITDKLFAFVAEFNELFLTSKEKALLVVLLFTMPDVDGLNDLDTLRDLNEYYTRALLYEFDVNKRDVTFMNKFKNVLVKIKENRALQAND